MENYRIIENMKINESREVASDLLSIFTTLITHSKDLALDREFIEGTTMIIQDIMNFDDIEENINYFVNIVCKRQGLRYTDLWVALSGLELYQSTINYFEKIIGKWDD